MVKSCESKSTAPLPVSPKKSKSCAVTWLSTYALTDCCVTPLVALSDTISSSSKNNDVLTAVPSSLITVSTLSFISSICCCNGVILTTCPDECDRPELAADPGKYLLGTDVVNSFVPVLTAVTKITSLLVALSGLITI